MTPGEKPYNEMTAAYLDNMRAGLEKMAADAQALADVRTLDAWALGGPDRRWGVFEADNGTIYCELLDLGAKHFEHLDSFDAARAYAAAWVRGLK